jgi:hypothetical protein
VKIGDLVRTKSPFEPEVCLVVGTRKDVGDDCFEVLALTGEFVTYNLRKGSLEVISESR